MRRRRGRRRDRRPRGRPRAGAAPRRAPGRGARARAADRRAPDRPLQRRDPRRDLLRAGLAEGAAVRRRGARAVRLLRRARDRRDARRQADRRHPRARAAAPRRARAAGGANGVEGLRRLGRDEMPRSSRTRRGIAALHSPNTGVVDFARGRRRASPPISSARAATVTAVGSAGCEESAAGSRSVHSRGATRRPSGGRLRRRVGGPPRASPPAPSPSRGSCPFRGAYLRLRPERARRSCAPTSTRCPIPSCRSSAPT